MNIVLIGYRGCGKSTAGRLLAQRLGWPFVDTDALVQHRSGRTIRAVFTDLMEGGFRVLESEVVAEVSQLDRHVISTGGGVLLRPENVTLLRRCGTLVWITAPAEVLWERILTDARRRHERPETDLAAGLEVVRQALRTRESIYRQSADVVIDGSDSSPDAVAERIETLVRTNDPSSGKPA